MSILAWLVIGGLAGWIASMIMKTNAQQGFIANIVVGVIGALIGGFLFNMLGGDGANGFNVYSLVVAVVGSVILLAILKTFRKA